MINVIGLGYIGLPTSLMLSSHGVDVIGTDINRELVKSLQSNTLTFEEKGLKELFDKALEKEIKFSSEYQKTNFYIISVPTPYNKETKKIDPIYVVKAFESVLEYCDDDSVAVIESTISPGTIDKYIRPLLKNTNKTIHLAHAPERIIPGNMIYELIHNNRTIGADDKETGEKIAKVYSSFCEGEISITSIKTAEMTKVIENTYRAVNIAFANELSRICNREDMDVYEVIDICNKHPRVNILKPGPGVGGHCISVDPWFLVGDYPNQSKVIGASMEVNSSQPDYVLKRIYEIVNENNIRDMSKIGIYGLTYKENVDDTRESPTLQLLERKGTDKFVVYDPYIKIDLVNNQCHDFNSFIKDIEMIVIMVGHNEIKEKIDTIKNKVVLDTRKVINLEKAYYL